MSSWRLGCGQGRSSCWTTSALTMPPASARPPQRGTATCSSRRPTSPDFTPIEQVFSKLKAILRGLGARTQDALQDAVRRAVEAITPDDAIAWFAHADISLPAQPT